MGEMMAEAMGSGTNGLPSGWTDQNTVYLSGLFGGLGMALAGGDQEQIATANWAGSNAAANNYLNHARPGNLLLSEQERYDSAVKACAGGDAVACKTKNELAQLSNGRARTLNEACAGGAATPQCQAATATAVAYGNTAVRDPNGNTYATSDYPNGYPSIGPVRSPMEDSFAGQVAQSTATGLVLAPIGMAAAEAPAIGVNAFNAYMAASASYSLTAAAGTGVGISAISYSGSVLGNSIYSSFNGGKDVASEFLARFSGARLVGSMVLGAGSGMLGTSMFGWAGIPNTITNITTIPGAIIRANVFGVSQAVGAAVDGAIRNNK